MKLPGIAGKVMKLRDPVVVEMLETARNLEAEGRSVVHLVRGEPDFDTPGHIREAAKRALDNGYTHYPPLRGYPELREAVASLLKREKNAAFDPGSEVLITTGATTGMFAALAALLNPGDEVLLPDPIYDTFANQVRFLDCMPVFIPAQREGGRFYLDLRTAVKRISSRTKAIVVNNPWNPTGAVMDGEELEALAVMIQGNDLYLVADEIYEKIVFPGSRHLSMVSLFPELKDRVITVNSLSKTYAMTGWRVGYNLASEQLTTAMYRVLQQCSRGPAAFVQQAALAALSGPQECVLQMQAEYEARREMMIRGLAEVEGFHPLKPEGTFFTFVHLENEKMDSRDLALSLLREAGVLVTPGSAFGPGGEGYLRFSFAHPRENIETGLKAVSEYMSSAD
jgi:aspartate/methionine/tyrosine aminotransferase